MILKLKKIDNSLGNTFKFLESIGFEKSSLDGEKLKYEFEWEHPLTDMVKLLVDNNGYITIINSIKINKITYDVYTNSVVQEFTVPPILDLLLDKDLLCFEKGGIF